MQKPGLGSPTSGRRRLVSTLIVLGFLVPISLFLDLRIFRDHTILVGDSEPPVAAIINWSSPTTSVAI